MARKPVSPFQLNEISKNFFRAQNIAAERKASPRGLQPRAITQQDLMNSLGFQHDTFFSGRGSVGLQTYAQYEQALRDSTKHSISFQKRLEILKSVGGDQAVNDEILELLQRENLDLTVLNREAADRIVDSYRGTIVPVQKILDQFGFPSLSLSSENAYRHLARYSLDLFDSVKSGEGIHPQMLSLLRTNFNIKEHATTPSDLSIGRSRLRNPISLKNLAERTKRLKVVDENVVNYLGFNLENIPDEGVLRTVLTYDTETTGLTAQARVRNYAIVKRVERVFKDGTTKLESAPEVVASKHFRSTGMDLAHAFVEGKAQPLSVATMMSEMGLTEEAAKNSPEFQRAMSALEGNGQIALEDLRDMLKMFLGQDDIVGRVDIVEGHNALSFDIDKLSDTIKSLPSYINQDSDLAREVKALQKEYTFKRAGLSNVRDPFFAQDTLDTLKIAMQIDREKISSTVQGVVGGIEGIDENAARLVSEYYASILSIDPEMIVGKKGIESLENILLNTNFLDLLEEQGSGLDEFFNLVSSRGTHTGEVDAFLTSYVSHFVNNGKLHIRRFPTAGFQTGTIDDTALQQLLEKHQGQINLALEQKGFLRGASEKYSNFAAFIRSKMRRSSAVTPVTNVADVQGLSDEAVKFVSENKIGRRLIEIAVSEQEARDLLRS